MKKLLTKVLLVAGMCAASSMAVSADSYLVNKYYEPEHPEYTYHSPSTTQYEELSEGFYLINLGAKIKSSSFPFTMMANFNAETGETTYFIVTKDIVIGGQDYRDSGNAMPAGRKLLYKTADGEVIICELAQPLYGEDFLFYSETFKGPGSMTYNQRKFVYFPVFKISKEDLEKLTTQNIIKIRIPMFHEVKDININGAKINDFNAYINLLKNEIDNEVIKIRTVTNPDDALIGF